METNLNNKFYVPSLEEFYVGFEYEFNDGGEWLKSKWNADVTIIGRLLKSIARVKYLDRQDIEDCGFEVQHIEDDGDIIYFEQAGKPHNQIVFHKYSGVHYKTGKYGDGFVRLNVPGRLSGHISIKNKSEFKKLLKQLGI